MIKNLLLTSVFLLATSLFAQTRAFNVTLPAGTKQIDAHRFQSSRTFEDTKKEFHERFRRSTTIKKMPDEINLPQVRAVFYKNTDVNAPFSAINIYQNVQSGITDIFFVPR